MVLRLGHWLEIPDRLIYERKWGLNHVVKVEDQWMTEERMEEGEVWKYGS